MEDFNTRDIVNNELDSKFRDLRPSLLPIAQSIQGEKTFGKVVPLDTTPDFLGGKPMVNVQQKASLTTQIPIQEAYTNVGGEWMKNFPTYKQGRDNYEYAAQNQTTMDKWLNGTTKALGKTANAIVGGTVGMVYGVGNAIEEQSWTALYDNNFSNWLNDLDQKMNYQLPNYYKKQEQDLGLFGQMGTANFWSDKVLGGLSFTAGAIVSEGIWAWATGGTSLATTGARWGTKFMQLSKVGNAIGKYSKVLKQGGLPSKMLIGATPKTAGIVGGQIGEAVNTLRFTFTSAGYESSVEALQFRKEAEENFYRNFESLNGRQPNEEDVAEFKQNLDSASNSVFATNMALVGSSNLLAFGKIFNIKSPVKTGMGSFLDKKLYGLGLDDATKVIAPSKIQRVNRMTLPYLRSMVEEGLYEEGGQSITSKTANKWIEHSYNPSAQMENFDMAGAIYENMSHQYGSKEGWVENGVGMIIGVIGEAGTRGRSADVKQKEGLFKQEADYNATYGKKAIGEHFLMLGRMKSFSEEAERQAKAGNITAEKIANDGVMLSYLNHKYQIGRDINDTVEDMRGALNTLTVENFAEMGVQESEIESFKETTLNEFKETAKQFTQNRKYAEYMIGRNTLKGLDKLKENNQLEGFAEINNELLIQSLTYNLTAGESANRVMSDITETLSKEIGSDYTASLKTLMSLGAQTTAVKNKVSKIRKQIPALEQERDALTQELVRLQNAPKETEADRGQGLRLGKVNERLVEVNSQIDSLNSQLTELAQEINNNREFKNETEGLGGDLSKIGVTFSQDSITPEDLINLEKNIDKLETLVENYKATNPQKASYIRDMIEEFKNANEAFKANQRTAIALSSGELKLENFNAWAQKKLQGKKSLDDFTNEWLADLLTNYTSMKRGLMAVEAQNKLQNEEDIITDEIFQKFTDDNEVSEQVLTDLAKKLSENQPFTDRESAVYKEKSQEVEDLLKQFVKPQQIQGTTQPLSKTEILRNRLDELIKNSFYNITGIVDAEGNVAVEKPTEEEINEYRELLTQPTEGLFADNAERLNQLQAKLGQWRLLDSAISDDNVSIAELIEQLAQLEQTIEEESTSTEITETQTIDLRDDSALEDSGSQVDNFEITQNTLGAVTVRKDVNKPEILSFYHLKPSSLITRMGGDGVVTMKTPSGVIENPTTEQMDNAEVGTIFEYDGLSFTLSSKAGTIEIRETLFNSFSQRLGMFITDTKSVTWSYKDVFYFNGADFVKMPSDYIENIEPQESYNMKQGDKVTLEVDSTDEYTAMLLDKYNKAKGKAKESAEKELMEQAKIYVVNKDSIRLSTMKALRGATSDTAIFEIRQRALEVLMKGESKLGIELEVSNIFMGSPRFTISDGRVQNTEFTQKATELVLATGFVENGELTLNKTFTDEINTTFIGKISKNKPSKKIPVVVVQKGAYKIAYPISVKKSKANKGSLVENLLNQGLTKPQLAIAINNLIQQEKINTSKVIAEELTDEKLSQIIEDFNNKEAFRTADEFADSQYKAEDLQRDALINIDLEDLDTAISDPKLKVSFDSMQYIEEVDVLEDDLVAIEKKLSDLAVELYNDYYSNASSKYLDSKGNIIEDTNYTNTFDDNPIKKTTDNIIQLRNINILEQAFSDITPSIKKIVGDDKINEVKSLLKNRARILSSVKSAKKIAKNGKNKVDNSCK